MNELHLFAGVGGGILAGQLLGHRTVCAVEWEPYAQAVLVARQNDGSLPPFPIWNDVRTFKGEPWRGIVDIVCGGFPCQDISTAGKGAGIDGERSGMWGEMARIIGEVRPRFVFVENSPALTSRGLGRVLGDLAALGFDAKWGVLGASDVGAPHKRERIWIVAHANADLQPGSAEPRQQQQRAAQPGGSGYVGLAAGDDVAHTIGQCDRGEIHGGEADGAQAERSASGVGGSGDGGAAQSEASPYAQRRPNEAGNQPGILVEAATSIQIGASDAVADPDGQRTHRGGSWPEQEGGDESSDDGTSADGLAHAMRIRRQRQGEYINPGDCETNCKGQAGNAFDVREYGKRSPVTGLGGASDGLAKVLDKLASPWRGDWEGDTPRVASGVTHRSHRLKAIGNGQVSLCAATAFNLLKP
jgi:site-specific DNA-cytosine methylase